jgi:hypothetical protein
VNDRYVTWQDTVWNICAAVMMAAIVTMCVWASGCKPSPHVPPAGHDCVAACVNLQSLQCPEGDPTPAGVVCSVWLCETPMPDARTSCVAKASSCEAARVCK